MLKIVPLKRFGITYWGVVLVHSRGQSTLHTFMSEEGAKTYMAQMHPHLRGKVA